MIYDVMHISNGNLVIQTVYSDDCDPTGETQEVLRTQCVRVHDLDRGDVCVLRGETLGQMRAAVMRSSFQIVKLNKDASH